MEEELAGREDLITEVLNRVDSIGEAISQGAVAGFDVLVRQQVISGIGFTMGALFCIIIGVLIIKMVNTTVAKYSNVTEQIIGLKDKDYYHPYRDVERIMNNYAWVSNLRFISILPFGIATTLLYQAIARFINPAYYAIKEVLHTFS